jgi:hypothetical protein
VRERGAPSHARTARRNDNAPPLRCPRPGPGAFAPARHPARITECQFGGWTGRSLGSSQNAPNEPSACGSKLATATERYRSSRERASGQAHIRPDVLRPIGEAVDSGLAS